MSSFDGELLNGLTDSVVSLGGRVEELERRETLTVGDAIGPFRWEVHVSQDGRGNFTSIKDACDFVAGQDNVGDVEWIIYVHAGDYEESPFTIPAFTTLEGVGGDVGIGPIGTLATDFITHSTFGATLRNIQVAANVSTVAVDVFLLNCSGQSLTLTGCLFSATVTTSGGNEVGTVKCTSAGFNFFGCEFSVANTNTGLQYGLYLQVEENQTGNYIRSCRIWRNNTLDSIGIYFAGTNAALYVLETSILPEDTDIYVDASATVYLRATDYATGDGPGTITYLYGAPGTVSSVGLVAPTDVFNVTGSPVEGSGNLTLSFDNQVANTVFAGPASGAAAAPTFRALTADDLPGVVIGAGDARHLGVWDAAGEELGYWPGLEMIDDSAGGEFKNVSLPSRLVIGGAGVIDYPASGYPVTDAYLQLSSSETTATANHVAYINMTALQTNGTDGLIGVVGFANRSYVATTDQRLIEIAAWTSGGLDGGYLTISTRATGGAIAEAMRITPTRSVLIGKTSGLTGAGDLDIDGNANIDGGLVIGSDLTVSGDDIVMATNTANYFLMADGTNYNPTSPADARTGLGLTAGGAGDIWVEKAGDTMTGALTLAYASALLTVQATSSGANLTVQSDAGNANLNFDASGQAQMNWRKMVVGTASARFLALMTSTAESGSNVGSNWQLLRRTDAGGSLGQPVLAIERATGFIGVNRAEATATYSLDVLGTFRVDAVTGGIATLYRTDSTIALNESIGKLEFGGSDSDLSTQNIFANIEVQAQAAIASDAAFGKMLLRTTGPGAATSPVERLVLGLVKTLTDAATNLFDVTLNAGEMAGGTVVWTIIASNGTDHQSYSGITTYAVVNKAGTYTSQITHNTTNDSKAVSGGTLTAAWAVLNGTNKVTIRVTPTGSLAETTYQILYSVHSNSPQSITIL